jgi:hypothetical protein
MIPNADITIYNKYVLNHAEVYQRAYVYDVVWQATKSVRGLSSGYLSSNVASIFIPLASGADYVKPKAWQALETKTGKWTLREGDIIARGIVDKTLSNMYTPTQLKAEFDDVVFITSVDDMLEGSEAVQHWEVGAK